MLLGQQGFASVPGCRRAMAGRADRANRLAAVNCGLYSWALGGSAAADDGQGHDGPRRRRENDFMGIEGKTLQFYNARAPRPP